MSTERFNKTGWPWNAEVVTKIRFWKWSGVLALDQNIGEAHRNSARQRQGPYENHSADPERGLKVSRTWSQGEEGSDPCQGKLDPDRHHEPLSRRNRRRQRGGAGICAGGTQQWNSFTGNKGSKTLPSFLVRGIWDIDFLSWLGEAHGLPWVGPMDFLRFLNLLLARLAIDIYS